MADETKYVAGRVVRIGGYAAAEDGTVSAVDDATQVHEFQPGDEVPGAESLTDLDGLVLNLYLVPADEYDEALAGDAGEPEGGAEE